MSIAVRTIATFVASALLGVVVPLSAFIVLGLTTVAIMLPTPPAWVRDHVDLSIFALELFAWLPPVLISVFLIRQLARSHAAAHGIVAGLFGVGTLAVALTLTPGHVSLIDAWREALLLLLLLPVACALPFKRVG